MSLYLISEELGEYIFEYAAALCLIRVIAFASWSMKRWIDMARIQSHVVPSLYLSIFARRTGHLASHDTPTFPVPQSLNRALTESAAFIAPGRVVARATHMARVLERERISTVDPCGSPYLGLDDAESKQSTTGRTDVGK